MGWVTTHGSSINRRLLRQQCEPPAPHSGSFIRSWWIYSLLSMSGLCGRLVHREKGVSVWGYVGKSELPLDSDTFFDTHQRVARARPAYVSPSLSAGF